MTLMFKSGYTLMLYGILENDVVDFLTYIPLEYYLGDKRKEIFSPRLAEILTRIGKPSGTLFLETGILFIVKILESCRSFKLWTF